MLFVSSKFLLFFLLVFCLYWSVPGKRLRVWMLLIASFAFYTSWSPQMAGLVAAFSTAVYFLGIRIDSASTPASRRRWLTLGIIGNLALLVYFKYTNFFLDSIESVLGSAGFSASLPTLKVILPIGISFYTFEAISYLVDIYRKHLRAERHLPDFLLFISFFPRVVAGPIIRAHHFLPQVSRKKRWSWNRMDLGIRLCLLGLFKKAVVADRMAYFADPVFATPEHFGTVTTWMAVIAYTIQIYCDFSGYSDMALGTAHLLGYKLPRNFDLPLLARNISDFWRRWHISLSSWLRDYLMQPLMRSAGRRPSSLWVDFCLLTTMMLCGLWHGAAWTFVVFGLMHGLLLILHRHFRDFCVSRPQWRTVLESRVGTACCVILTLVTVMLTFCFFRAANFDLALGMLTRLTVPTTGVSVPPLAPSSWWFFVALVILGHAVSHSPWSKRPLLNVPAPVAGVGYAIVLCATLLLTPGSGKAFIYFQF